MTTRRILLIDDNPHDLELALSAFGDAQADGVEYAVDVAGSGQEAMERMQQALSGGQEGLPDLVLLDLKMPQMDGLAVLDALQAEEGLRDIPVVMLTTSGEDRDIRASYEHGASAYVIKPMDFRQFREAMHTIRAFWATLNHRPRLR
ncbi:response regulator [Deinococcus koreensis]|uniref:Response regulator n=1 Tax=Deinococcus koreensis TaxID=2054903 RepID=A0A2K3UYU1_9DEIO|nr:response regulator [Deinococcus koreensis]PNY81692.1 response regulator [Deinococcus koreensis]